MKVLYSPKAFREHYVRRSGTALDKVKSVGGGSLAGLLTWLAGTSVAAGKTAAVASVTGTVTFGGAPVLIPAALLGCGVAYGIYRCRNKKSLQGSSGIGELANCFAHVAFLPMMALAASVCRSNPKNEGPVRDYVLGEMGAWGYSESYIRDLFTEALSRSPEVLNDRYRWAINLLESGSTHGIGATPAELPVKVVQDFAEDFVRDFKSQIA